MSSTLDSKVLSLFQQTQSALNAARANTGESSQGNFPPDGVHPCFITGLSMKADVFKFMEKTGPDTIVARELPCITAQFEFARIMSQDDPTYKKDEDYSFRGERFQLVPGGEDAIPAQEEGTRTRVRMSWDRFLGHCSTILGRPPEECKTPTIAQETYAACTGAEKVAVSVKCVTKTSAGKGKNTGKTFKNQTEYLINRLDTTA